MHSKFTKRGWQFRGGNVFNTQKENPRYLRN
jgi:hypothetical protein